MAQQHIAIIGAGLLGRLLGWQLLEQGQRISLFEAGSFSQPLSAAHTAAAMISPLSEVVISDRSVYDMGLQSLALWPKWIAELNQKFKADDIQSIQYQANGSIVVAHAEDSAELLQFKNDLVAKLGSDDNSKWLSHQQICQRESALEHFHQGLWLPDEAYLDNRALLKILLLSIKKLGGQLFENTVVNIDETRVSSYPSAEGPSSKLRVPPVFDFDSADLIIDCRGFGAKKTLSKNITNNSKLRGVRGEVMWVETSEITLQHAIRLMHPRYKLYVVPKPNQQFIIGATEIESEDLSPISLQSNLELASALYTINPAFAEARVIATDVNLRPAFTDNLPAITQNDRILHVNGLYRHGYLLAPTIVHQTLDLVSNILDMPKEQRSANR